MSGAALLVIAGGITFIISSLGIVGACGMWRPVLIIVRVFCNYVSCVPVFH